MRQFKRISRQGLYRSRDGIILGVCRGVADYFEFSAFWIRAILIAGLIFTGFWPVIGIYILAALLMKSEPEATAGQGSKKRNFHCRRDLGRQAAAERFRRKWRHLEKRIRRMEDRVTSGEFDWDRRFYE